ncbi:MAG: hypothetical protein HY862_05810 [Chloroflexi bacterium]|nr:hypothetical protein [Chloroflexota bacterium]
MLTNYHHDPILAVYYYPKPQWGIPQLKSDLDAFAASGLKQVWLFFDPFYDVADMAGLKALLDHAASVSLGIVPALGQFLQLHEHPEVKIVNADGTTSDDPRYWNMGCFRQPKLFELASGRSVGFFRDFGEHPALYHIEGKPLMNFVHEAYYRNNVPEFGSGPMHPNCYCPHCLEAFRDYLAAHNLDPETPAPKTNADPVLWQHWIDCHAEAIPEFLRRLIAVTNLQMPVWATHECNDFYPASWQSVHTGNDWWRMGAVLDFGHEDMYPLEFDTRYQCYVYDYTKDIMRSATGFNKLVTCNGQAFNSWLGYKLPENSMMEQIYSALSHGALGLVWWTELPGLDSHTDYTEIRPDRLTSPRYKMISQTEKANQRYVELVSKLQDYQLTQAKVALLYSWTTMSQELADDHTYDTLLTYMALVQNGYPIDVLSEEHVAAGLLQQRGYQALLVMGVAAVPMATQTAITEFLDAGGLVIADYAPTLNADFVPLFGQWRGQAESKPRVYTLPNDTPIPVQLAAAPLNPPLHAEVLASFEDGTPAICRIQQGQGTLVLGGSYFGWDYTNYPGYYDLAAMFPFHTRRDEILRRFLADLLKSAGIFPPAESSHPDVEVGVWHTSPKDAYVLLVTNHLQETVRTTVRLMVGIGHWTIQTPDVQWHQDGHEVVVELELTRLDGTAIEVIKA